ncbi:stage II sporulation protein P [Pseudoflavonifractor capillosus]|uniref:stage II sporulation protein P n=1 Tax=Pseudoflavonifractor capillosus TaxID=106588 RepID=UPI00195C6991|nr:stage II sporulation protein P [Pseudoflavonifractor capillosus]MBM6897287.1 stage II sporulation protein P [Pseudoflavonifractor capillosus]
MQKNRTRAPLLRGMRQGIALFLTAVALWIIYLTADPALALQKLKQLAQLDQLTSALLDFELPWDTQSSLPVWEQVILGQSSLLSGAAQATAVPAPTATPEPETVEEEKDETPPQTTTAPDGIIPSTLKASNSPVYATYDNVSIRNYTDYPLDVKALLEAAPQLTPAEDGPDVLIYHSHATEAYTMDGTDMYEETDNHRTLNTEQNMVRIGTEMTKILEEAGLEVIHDTTLYDYPDYNEAYNRSSQAVKETLDKYPSIRLVIDVHRDALVANDGTIYKTVAGTVDNCAQVMMVMGTDSQGQTHPNWRVNLSLATAIQKALADKWSTLARPIALRTSRFNQHYSTGCLLVEIGSHGNTLQEATTAGRLFARTIADLFQSK